MPSWAALSLAINGVLFLTLIGLWQQKSDSAPQVRPQAGVAYAARSNAPPQLAHLGDRQRLQYEQWVKLLEQEMDAMAAKHPDHLTILLGDSLSLWFPSQLLPGRRVWMNQGISGEKTDGLRQRLYLLDRAEVDTIFLMIGINDLIWGQSDRQLLANYRDILEYLAQRHPNTDIVIQSILPHGAETATWEGRERLLALPNQRIQDVNRALANLAKEYEAHYLELYPIFSDGEGRLRADLTTDGLHLNQEGYLVWRAAIALYSQLQLQP